MKAPIMMNRRETLSRGVRVAALMAAAGLLPAAAQAAWSMDAFDAKTLADTVKAPGGSAPVQSAGGTTSGPDIARALPKPKGLPVTYVRGRDGRLLMAEAGQLFPEDVEQIARFL
jgi:hypothetical protein